MTRAPIPVAAAALGSPARLAAEEILFTRSFDLSGARDRLTCEAFGRDSRARHASNAVERLGAEAAFRGLHRCPMQRGA